ALAQHLRGDYASAVASFTDIIQTEPGLARAHHWLAHSLLAAGDLSAAEASCERAVALDPADANAWNTLGEIRNRHGCVFVSGAPTSSRL
ncbi:MAG: tetratricopeptide repeat protein, partial [Terracidiphilus sp.]|nr:tetratricopeptide repeat protein [Terracidiphilus sp.]